MSVMEKNNPYIHNLGSLFYSVCSRSKDRAAIVSEDGKEISFAELNSLSNRIANHLLAKGLNKSDVVCFFNDKSFHAFASMLACIKCGIIYVNLDHTSPAERIKKIVSTCNPQLILNFFGDKVFSDFNLINSVNVSGNNLEKMVSAQSSHNIDVSQITGSSPAYIMFTSGSTGFPKGATMTHANVLNFISWGRTEYKITSDDKLTNVNPVYFDNSVFDFYVSLFNGASLLPFLPDTVKDPKLLVSKINERKPTIWFSVPSMLIFLLTTKVISDNDFISLRVITFGGEGFPKTKLKQLFDLYKSHARFVNVYGPTECTCICSAHDITENDFIDMTGIPTLGNLTRDFSHLILNDENNQPALTGELCLLGSQVGLGYYNDPERTSKSFVQNPMNSSSAEMMYKTGDLVSLKDDGKLYFVGRKDNQIKHMGYRIELEEIEAVINTLPGTRETCVVYKKETNGLGQIIAYVVSNDKGSDILGATRNLLPSYMIPRQVIVLDSLPKNKNGKIDRVELTAKALS